MTKSYRKKLDHINVVSHHPYEFQYSFRSK